MAQINYSDSLANATLIYSNGFDGAAVNISNTPPDYGLGVFGGSSGAVWIDAGTPTDTNAFYANGDVGTAQGDSILLPFEPQSGHVYTLTASVTLAGNPGNWVGAGFAQNYAMPGIGNARFADSGVNGYDFAILNESSRNVQFFGGPHATLGIFNQNGFFESGPGTHTLKLILDTTDPQWAIACYVDGVQAGTNATPFASEPPIHAVGITQNGLASGGQANVHWNSLTLSAAQLLILQQPTSETVDAGATFTNSVVVGGAPPFYYQWRANGAAIAGATNSDLILSNASPADNSVGCDVVITNNYGAVTSAVAILTVYTKPAFSGLYPISYTNRISLFGGTNSDGTNFIGSSPTFSVSATGATPLTYQWFTNGVTMNGATQASLTFTNAPMDGPTNFAVIVTNDYGSITSTVFSVQYIPTPRAPYPQAVLAAQPLAYWRLDEQPANGKGNNGIICNDYQSGNNGIYTNVTLAEPGYDGTTDPSETSVEFGETGSSNNSDAGQIEGLDFATGDGEFTIEAWANGNATGQSSGAPVVTKGIYGLNDEFALDLDTSAPPHYQFYVRAASGAVYTADSNFAPDGAWHHLVGVCDQANGQVLLYIDGRPAASTIIPAGAGVSEANWPLSIGAGIRNAATGYTLQFQGDIDDVAAYNYALQPARIVAQFSAAGGAITPFLALSPPTNITVATAETLTIPALSAGSSLLADTWRDPNGNVLATSSTNGFLLNAALTVPSVPASWNGAQLELSVTNAYGSTNFFVTLDVVSNYASTVNPASVLVTNFQGWGTSLQWWANVVGGYSNRSDYIDLLFDTLKLNLVRYEIGAGQNPAVNNPRTPYKAMMQGFELTNGIWNWNADLNQRWVLRQAEENGANLVEAFAVSPPWWMCVSSNVDGNMAGTNNLQTDCETNFAIYLATVVSNLTVLDGDHFNDLIPMNEPSLGTVGQETNGYETCHVSNDQQQRLIQDVRAQLDAEAPSVGVDAPGDFDEYEAYTDLKEYSPSTLGDLRLFSTHSYIQNDPANLSAEAQSQKKSLWVAEYGDSDSTGLTMAQHIHDDITGMKVAAWVYWMAVNSDVGNAFLYNGLAAPTNPGFSTAYIIYKKFYAMGQFSEFIRPGCQIVSVNDPYTLAAWNPANSSLVLVMVNTNNSSFGVTYNLSDFGPIPWRQVAAVQTSPGENMLALPPTTILNNQFTSVVPAQSITTFILNSNPLPPGIVSQVPAPYTTLDLFPGKSPTLSVAATGTPPLFYQWTSNNIPVSGAVNADYTPPAPTEGITNDYQCIVTNSAGLITSMVWSVTAVPGPTASYDRAALALDPVGFWPLNEAEQGRGDDGVIARDYAGGNNGIYTNVLLGQMSYNSFTDPSATSALFGYVNSNNSCVFGIDGPDFSLPNGSDAEFSVAAWVNSTGANALNTPTIAAKGYYYQEEYALDAGAQPNECFRFSVRDAAGSACNANSALSLTNIGQWYHLVGVCDEARSLVLLYTNGALAASAAIPTASGITNSSGTLMTIGARSSHPGSGFDQQFPGFIADVAIYDYALTANQVQLLYQAGISLSSSGLSLTTINGSKMSLNWNYGILQTATNLAGPYSDLTDAIAPYLMRFTNSQRFFRIREN